MLNIVKLQTVATTEFIISTNLETVEAHIFSN